MSWEEHELDGLLDRDIDDVVERARGLDHKDRGRALENALSRVETTREPLDRLKILQFVQTLLAFVPDHELPQELSERTASELA
ncbi:MAG TPA: hypothetical protein VMU84_21060, partial [Thermoanaerobaculia bacterium]|nr:hypothetical protein [Thermoanaerobaculia bacterium]